MKSIGSTLLFFGIGSVVLFFMEREFVILSWIENWGETAAWSIRGAMIVIGAALWFIGNKQESETQEEKAQEA